MHWVLASFLMSASFGPMGPEAPAREPQVAVRGSNVAIAFGAGHSIYFSGSSDGGRTFSKPVQVGGGNVIPLNRHRGPRIAFAGDAIVISAVVGVTAARGEHAHGLPSDGDLLVWRSTDAGKTWTKKIVVNDVADAPTEGLHGLGSDGKDRLFAAWLDKRSGKTALYGSLSTDGGRTWSKNVRIYASPEGTICECCHPSVAFDRQGAVVVIWRNWLGGSRDMYLARSTDGMRFAAAKKLGEGTWKLNACPMDGGGIAVSDQGVVTAWRRDRSLFLDRPGERETEIGEGIDIAVAAGSRGVYAIWTGRTGIEFLEPGKKQARVIGPKGSFPAVATLPAGGAIVAWEDAGRISVQLVQ